MSKLKVDNSTIVATAAILTAIPTNGLADGTIRMLGDDLFCYYDLGVIGDHKADDKIGQTGGYWIKNNQDIKTVMSIVDDAYDFAGNNSTDISDTNSNALNVFPGFGQILIGSTFGFNDWMCLRDQVKEHLENITGADYSTWASLTDSQKKTGLVYCPTKVVKEKGAAFFGTECVTAGVNPNEVIKDYIIQASQAREKRYYELVTYAYQQLVQGDGLKAEDLVRDNNLKSKFIERGVIHTSEDGVDGLDDWIQSSDTFASTGLLAKLNDATYSLIDPGLTNEQFCNNCSSITNDGQY